MSLPRRPLLLLGLILCLAGIATAQTTPDPCNIHGLNETCKQCLDNSDCVWCGGPVAPCRLKGKSFPVEAQDGNGCSTYSLYYETCQSPWNVLMAIAISFGIALGALLLVGLYCCYRKWNKKRYRRYLNKIAAEEEAQYQARAARQSERKSERKARTDDIRMKYNLLPEDRY